MLRKRIPKQDDGAIFGMVDQLLLPFTRETKPGLSLSRTTLRHRLKPCVTYVEAGPGRTVAGFISLRPNRDTLFIDMLAVQSRYQGRGVGGRLMQQADRVAQRLGSRSIGLWVDESNYKAQRFYEKKGFHPVHYDARVRCYFLIKDMA
jgi:ribosomal protein S18 acetylase RimI-like enzyme